MSGYVSFHVPRWWFWIRLSVLGQWAIVIYAVRRGQCPPWSKTDSKSLYQENAQMSKMNQLPIIYQEWFTIPYGPYPIKNSQNFSITQMLWNYFEFSTLEVFQAFKDFKIHSLLNSEKEKLWNGKYARIFRTISQKLTKTPNQMMILISYFRSMSTQLSTFSLIWDNDLLRNGHFKCFSV